MSEIGKIISQLENQRASIERAIAALREVDAPGPAAPRAPKADLGTAPRKRMISAEGRRRIAEATRKRWADKRAADAAAAAGATKKAPAKKASKSK